MIGWKPMTRRGRTLLIVKVNKIEICKEQSK